MVQYCNPFGMQLGVVEFEKTKEWKKGIDELWMVCGTISYTALTCKFPEPGHKPKLFWFDWSNYCTKLLRNKDTTNISSAFTFIRAFSVVKVSFSSPWGGPRSSRWSQAPSLWRLGVSMRDYHYFVFYIKYFIYFIFCFTYRLDFIYIMHHLRR